MKRTIIFLTGILIISTPLHAQIRDLVMIDGETHTVRADLLYRYLSSHCPKDMVEEYVETFCEPHGTDYARYWEVREKRLYLLKIETNDKTVQYPLERMFPKYDGSPVHANWFSGIMSYRSGNSPEIQLNRKYYEEEEVIRFARGVEVERYKVNHRERWINDSKRIMDEYRPLKDPPPLVNQADPAYQPGMVEILENAFLVVTDPEEEISFYLPSIAVEFNADLDDFRITEAHRELTSFKLLETIAEETGTILDITVSNRVVIYEIRESDAAGEAPAAP